MSAAMRDKVAYTVAEAAEATGVSEATIARAVRAGDIRATRPRVDGKPVAKYLIARAELERWASDGAVAP